MPKQTTNTSKQELPDFYAILEVEKSASPADVRKSYRKLALRWHPDKNPEQQELATKKFKEISEAYEVLSDEEKRRIYDRGPTEEEFFRRRNHRHSHHHSHDTDSDDDLNGFFQFPHFVFRDPADIFREFFEGTDPFAEMVAGLIGGHHHNHRVHRNRHRAVSNHVCHAHGHNGRHENISAAAAGNAGSPHRNERRQRRQHHNHMISTVLDPFGSIGGNLSPFGSFGSSLSPFGGISPFGGLLGGGIQSMFGNMDLFGDNGRNGSFTQTSFSSSSMGGGGNGIRSTSTTTRIVNGQKITTTQRTMSDGTTTQETVYQSVPTQRRSRSHINDIITID